MSRHLSSCTTFNQINTDYFFDSVTHPTITLKAKVAKDIKINNVISITIFVIIIIFIIKAIANITM